MIRAVVLAIAHSEEAKRHRRNKHDSRNTPPDVRDSAARSGTRQRMDRTLTPSAPRLPSATSGLIAAYEIAFFEELKSDVEPWMTPSAQMRVYVRAVLQNNVAALKKRGLPHASEKEIESFRRELRPQPAELNRRSADTQPELLRRFGIGRELRLQGGRSPARR